MVKLHNVFINTVVSNSFKETYNLKILLDFINRTFNMYKHLFFNERDPFQVEFENFNLFI